MTERHIELVEGQGKKKELRIHGHPCVPGTGMGTSLNLILINLYNNSETNVIRHSISQL